MTDWLAASGWAALAIVAVAGIGYVALMAVAAWRCCAPEAAPGPGPPDVLRHCLECVCAFAPGPGCEGCGLNDPQFGCLGREKARCGRRWCEQARAAIRPPRKGGGRVDG